MRSPEPGQNIVLIRLHVEKPESRRVMSSYDLLSNIKLSDSLIKGTGLQLSVIQPFVFAGSIVLLKTFHNTWLIQINIIY